MMLTFITSDTLACLYVLRWRFVRQQRSIIKIVLTETGIKAKSKKPFNEFVKIRVEIIDEAM